MKHNGRRPSPEVLHYAAGDTAFGCLVLVWSERGLCAVRPVAEGGVGKTLDELGRAFRVAELVEDVGRGADWFAQVRAVLAGRADADRLALDLRGTPFQKRVWQALLSVPRGSTCSYSELARRAGYPGAARAVGSACGRNPVGLIVPCHRILRADGGLGGYGWGLEVKRRVLRSENVEV